MCFCFIVFGYADPGSSVRRCAIKIIKDCAIAVEGFPRAVDACCALIARANDPEETVQNAVAKVFHSLWFSSTLETEAGVVSRTPAQRAQQLADVALACYDAGGSAIHLPLDSQHSLVGVLRAALGWGARGDLHTEWASGQVISEALLEAILALQQRGQGVLGIEGDTTMDSSDADAEDGDAMTAALLALHALAVTDAALCVPEADPLRFLRALAPYLKTGGPSDGEQPSTERGQRRAAERMLCMLCIMDCVLSQVARLDDAMGALTDLPADLVTLINQHRFTQVVAAACKCLAALAEHNKQAASRLAQVAAVYFSWLKAPKTQNPGNLPRFLFIMGQLSRYGSSIIAAATPAITPAACLELFTQYWHYNGPPGLSGQVRRCALEALGQLAIAQPTALVASGSHAKQMLKEALGADAPPAYKMAALGSLTELLQADAESLQRRQKQQDEEAAAITAGAAKKAKGKKGKKGAPTEGSGAAVPTENGEGDALSQSSAILQQHWEAVLVLATDGGRTPGSNGPNPPGNGRMNESGVAVRRRVLSLMEVVLRDGLVGPWTAVPALVALCTDTALDLRTKALRLLCQLAEKHPQYVDAGRLGAGIEASFALHVPQEKAALPLRRGEPAVPAAAEHGIAAVYSRVVAANRSRRNDFLRAVLRPFRSALGSSSSEAGGQQTPRRLLAFAAGVAASLPLRQAEEGCILIQEAGSLVSAHTNRVLVELGAHLEADEDEVSMT